MKILLALSLAMIASLNVAHAADLDLACVTESSDVEFKSREIVITENTEVTIESVKPVSKKVSPPLAVIIEIIPGDENNPAKESYEYRNQLEFSLDAVVGIPEQAPAYHFLDKKTGELFICSPNEVVTANPALSRSN